MDSGRTLYLKNMVDKEGQSFNAYVRMDKEQNRPRFYKWNPDKSQKTGKVEVVAEENKTQVAVNNHGKTNEATKDLKEPLEKKNLYKIFYSCEWRIAIQVVTLQMERNICNLYKEIL